MQQTVQKAFQEDTLFQNQRFNYYHTGTYHLLKEVVNHGDGDPEYVALCGESTSLGDPESLTEKAEGYGHTHDHPKQFTGRVCRSCERIFERKTGRTPREDLEKYDGGEDDAK